MNPALEQQGPGAYLPESSMNWASAGVAGKAVKTGD